MKPLIKLLPAVLLLLAVALSGCEKDKDVIKIKNATATIISECSKYGTDYNDSITIKLDEMPAEILGIYPHKPFSDGFREVGLKVVVSGVIDKTTAKTNQCLAAPHIKLAPSHKFKITSIKKR